MSALEELWGTQVSISIVFPWLRTWRATYSRSVLWCEPWSLLQAARRVVGADYKWKGVLRTGFPWEHREGGPQTQLSRGSAKNTTRRRRWPSFWVWRVSLRCAVEDIPSLVGGWLASLINKTWILPTMHVSIKTPTAGPHVRSLALTLSKTPQMVRIQIVLL